ncbi:MAG: hypothetical protein RL757_426 [Bacteroidota bacterium]|jgi:hypothetical protein
MKSKILIGSIAFLFSITACRSIVNPNEWVVSTTNCWNSMSVTKAGSAIPRLTTNCDRMVILPATLMAADFTVETKFESRVAGAINLTYQWRISDAIKFIGSAKSITSSPTDGDHKIDVNALEAVENAVVDKMIIDVIREYTPSKSAGIDELTIEKDLFELCKSRFLERGVEFASLSVNVNFSPQIEEALDVMSALKFYEANGEKELGKEVIKAKAGAANIQSK